MKGDLITEKEKIALTFYYGLGGKKRHTLPQVFDSLATYGYTTTGGNKRVSQILARALHKLGLEDCRHSGSGYWGATAKAQHRLLVEKVGRVVRVNRGWRIEHIEIRDALEQWLENIEGNEN